MRNRLSSPDWLSATFGAYPRTFAVTGALAALVLMLAACGGDGDGNGGNGVDPDADPTTPAECDTVNTQCRTPLPTNEGRARVMIDHINLRDDYVVLKSVDPDGSEIDGWWVCQVGSDCQPVPSVSLNLADKVWVFLGRSGTDTADEVYVPGARGLERADEIAFFSSENFESASDIEVYLRWGSPAGGTGYSAQAASSGLWRQGNYVPVCGDNEGIVATGDGFLPIGFRDVPLSCPVFQ